MPFERTTVNQKVQIGAESTSALRTSVAALKLVQCFSWQFQIEADVVFYTPTGRKYPSTQEENMEWTSASMSGTFDYNCSIYPLAGAMGSVTPVAHGPSVTAKDWISSPPLSGSVLPQTYTIQQGDSVRAHALSYGLFTDWGYKGTRKDFTTAGKLIGQKLADAATLPSSPTAVALAPVVASQVNVYLDPTYGALGTTQLLRVLAIEFDMSNIYAPLWVLNRATPSWTAHVDTLPKTSGKLKVEADAAGMAMLAYLQSGATYYLRMDALGAQIASDGTGASPIYNEIKHDMAIKFGKPTAFADDSGVFAIEWTFELVEDSVWGHSQQITATNLLTAL